MNKLNIFVALAILLVCCEGTSLSPKEQKKLAKKEKKERRRQEKLEKLRGPEGPAGPMGPKGEPGENCECKEPSNVIDELKDSQNPQNLPRSCLEVKNNGISVGDGVYYLSDSNNFKYPVYCDMSIDDGGWTLVASVHENDAIGKCTVGDRWSSQNGNHYFSKTGANAWFDYQTFGQVISATSDDYKNAAYFEQEAQNIMIWQVPNDTPLQDYSSASYLKYRTNNDFLSQYKGNLFNLYKEYFPLRSGDQDTIIENGPAVPVVFDEGNETMVIELYGKFVSEVAEPGYIEFRAVNRELSVYAMCPGTKGKDFHLDSEHNCIGSSADNFDERYCGDFSGYSLDHHDPSWSWNAHLKLLQSTYLIFYR